VGCLQSSTVGCLPCIKLMLWRKCVTLNFIESLCILCVRYHLKGVKAGHAEVFVDNLPCLPDNIRLSSSGGYWIACGTARYDGKFNTLDFVGPWPWIRWIATKVSAGSSCKGVCLVSMV